MHLEKNGLADQFIYEGRVKIIRFSSVHSLRFTHKPQPKKQLDKFVFNRYEIKHLIELERLVKENFDC